MPDQTAIIAQLTENNHQLTQEVSDLREQVAHLTEQIAYLTRKLYGKSSEKDLNTDEDQSEDDDSPRSR